MLRSKLPCLTITNVTVGYGREPVLQGVSLGIGEGEVLCLVGASGTGKTTLLHAIGGLVEFSHGAIELDGQPISGPGPDRARVFQEDAVFPWFTVADNVRYSLRIRNAPREEQRRAVETYLNMVGLAHVATRYPRELSGGMRKRVDLARVLAAQPRIILMDEPYASLDAFTKAKLQADFLHLCETAHATSIFVTHDLEEAIYIGDRVAILSGHPAAIKRIIVVPFQHPRSRDIRLHPDFQKLRGELEGELEV